jgi:hypothetical protein
MPLELHFIEADGVQGRKFSRQTLRSECFDHPEIGSRLGQHYLDRLAVTVAASAQNVRLARDGIKQNS